jgi:protocatechuate 3,4-dioxygenase beta subunit
MVSIFALILVLLSVQPPQPTESTGRIVGRVTVDGANTAIAGARITLLPAGRQSGPMGAAPQALTDQDGRFMFDRVAPGTYGVDVQKTGFVSPNQPPHAPSLTVDVVAGRATTLDLPLKKGGVITGRVLDPAGEPMADVHILALRRAPVMPGASASRLFPVAGAGAPTNDIGEFRMAGLGTGEYYIVATPRGGTPFGGPAAMPPTGNARVTIAATFYPGTTDEAAAQPITVSAGAEVANISFTMQAAPAFRVSGVVVDETGEPVVDAMVMIIPDGQNRMFMGSIASGPSRVGGRFTIGEVSAGSYRVSASIPIRMNGSGGGSAVTFGGGAIVTGGAAVSASSGAVPTESVGVAGGVEQPVAVTITDADVSGVRVVVRRPVRP